MAAGEEPCHIVIPSEQRERGIPPNFVICCGIAPGGDVILSGASRQSCCVIAPRGRCHSERSAPTDFPPEIMLLIPGRDAQSKNLSWISQANACRLARACASTSFKALRKRHHVPRFRKYWWFRILLRPNRRAKIARRSAYFSFSFSLPSALFSSRKVRKSPAASRRRAHCS
jgi:hypothetical protein